MNKEEMAKIYAEECLEDTWDDDKFMKKKFLKLISISFLAGYKHCLALHSNHNKEVNDKNE